jgi:hypothetical protein
MKRASPIHQLERDYFLHFDRELETWPPEDLPILTAEPPEEQTKAEEWRAGVWQRQILQAEGGGYLAREITRSARKGEGVSKRERTLREAMLRFPSAPLFGCQSKTDFQVRMTSFHQHTLRLLTSARADGDAPVQKLYLIFNGLNELDQFKFYYDLSGLLIENEPEGIKVGCLIVPFPAHLTRYPMIGRYAEKPMQRFISDPSDLFRQYLRFIVEIQWLISTLVPVGHYPVTSGIPLLAPNREANASRCNPDVLSSAIHESWDEIFAYSRKHRDHDVPSQKEPRVRKDDIRKSITVIRRLIGWQSSATTLTARDKDKDEPLDPPQLHVIGYSLGGYLAQSVFFTWPYAIGSCTTLCSGGALTSLRPEKIMHEEEWRAITHGLKYEIESGMLEGRIAADKATPQRICGIPASNFTAHFQTFTDIFLQDPYGTYRHRVSEFAHRMFFVVGGNDPIVPTRSVLDTSPPEGINLIEIAHLSHFIAMESGEWADFWLPTIVTIISSFSDHSEKLLKTTTLENLWNDDMSNAAEDETLDLQTLQIRTAKAFGPQARDDRRDPEPLNSEQLQTTILECVKLLDVKSPDKNGFLFVLRNEIPVTLMGQRVLHRRGTVPHYADFEIGRFWARLQEQRLRMRDYSAGRIAIVVPGRLNKWFVHRLPTLSYKNLPVVQDAPNSEQRQIEIWQSFLSDWESTGALYRFDAERLTGFSLEEFELERMIRDDTSTPETSWILNCLPDTWISLSGSAVTLLAGEEGGRKEILTAFKKRMLRIYTAQRKGKGQTAEEVKAREDLYQWLDDGSLRILRISAAQSSPRFLGERIRSHYTAIDIMTHTALALARSQQCQKPGDFARGWKD